MPAAERRSRLLVFRVRIDEERRIRAAAEAAGVRVGEWLRQAALKAAGRRGGRERKRAGGSGAPPAT